MQKNEPKDSFLLKVKNYFFSTPKWVKEAKKKVPELTAEFQATESNEAAKNVCVSYLKEICKKETASTTAERAAQFFDSEFDDKFTSLGKHTKTADENFYRDFVAFVKAYLNDSRFDGKVATLAEIIGNDSICDDAENRPYENLLKKSEGEPLSEEYKKQCLILAAFCQKNETPYKYNILSSNKEKTE